MSKIIFTPVGVSFPEVAPNIELLKVGDVVSFNHLPSFYGSGDKRKEYPNAVVVLFDGKKVGSLAESSLKESPQQVILKMIKAGDSPVGVVTELIIPNKGDSFKRTYKLSVLVPDIIKDKPTTLIKKKSWNEGVIIDYIPDPIHEYHYKGKQLTSVTRSLKKFYKEFDLENIAKASAKSWGVDTESVKDIWESNRNISALFGTAIHNALEHYETHCEIGKIISDSRSDESNYALPKHPLLKSIIEGFIEINKIKGDVVTEVLLSDVANGICGHADRLVVLDWDKKICRVGDYKINIGAEIVSSKDKVLAPFSHLPSNKISKYQLQMSIYANMLQKSGWTVDGLDVYIYEDNWKYYPLEVLTIL